MAWLFTFAFCRLACVVSCHVCLRSLLIAFNINGWTNREEKEGRKRQEGNSLFSREHQLYKYNPILAYSQGAVALHLHLL